MRLRWGIGFSILFVALLVSCVVARTPSVIAENAAVSVGVGDTILQVSGNTSPGAFVTVTLDGNTIGTTTADPNGYFSQTYGAQPSGIHTIGLTAETPSGVETDPVTQQINITEHATTTVNVFLPSTLQLSGQALSYGEPLGLNGETAPNSTVNIFIDNAVYTTAQSDSNGLWSIQIDTLQLASGQHTVFVKVVNGLGEQSYPTTARTFTLSGQPIMPPEPGTPPPAPVITFPTQGLEWDQPSITVTGTGVPGTQIELWDGNRNLGSVWVDANGNWSLVLRLTPGEYALHARSCIAGVCGPFSTTVQFVYTLQPGTPGECSLRVEVPRTAFALYTQEWVSLLTFMSGGQPPYTARVAWQAPNPETVDYTGDNPIPVQQYLTPGRYSIVMTVRDAVGCEDTLYFTADVRPRPATAAWFVWMLWLMIGLAVVLSLVYAYKASRTHKKG